MTTRITTSNIDPTALIAIQGPIISSIQVTSNNYVVLDDTAVDTAGGFIRINGSNFTSSTQVIIGSQLATSVTFVNSSTLNVQVPAQSAGTYTVYVTNNNGDVAIMVMGVTYSPIPAWSTGSTLPGGVVNSSLSIQLNASGDGSITYAVANGSSLPPGLTLSSNGLLSGAATGITSETTYNFNVNAIDAQLQDASRTFSITIAANDPNLRNTTTLLSASNPSSNFVTDAGANSFDITVNGDVRPSNFGPYTPGYYSGSFSSGGISWPGSAALALGTGDFTIECWVNYTSEASRFLTNRVSFSAGSGTWSWSFNSTSIAFVTVIPGEPGVSNSSVSIPTNRWNHLAVVRSSGVITFYVNGTSFAGGSFGYDLGNTDQSYLLGSTSEKNGFNFTGSISNLRILKGTALYTSSFTPSTTPLTAVANTQLLICQSNRFRDESNNNVALTPSSATITGFDPFVPSASFAGRGSGFFDGTGDTLTVPSSTPNQFGSGDFTLECWYYSSGSISTSGQHLFFRRTTAAAIGMIFQIDSSRLQLIAGDSNTSGWEVNISSTTTLVAGVWYHFAATRSGSTWRIFVNGVQEASATSSFTIAEETANIVIGTNITGYLSDWRALKGTALYTTNFTPPTAPLTAIANTSLLTLQNNQPNNNSMFLDGSTNNLNITRNGNTTQGSFSPYGGGWSNFFDGNGDYLTVPYTTSAFDWWTSDYTIEAWIYPTTLSGLSYGAGGGDVHPTLIGNRVFNSPTDYWSFGLNAANGTAIFYYFNGSPNNVSSTATVNLNQWNHIAMTRTSSGIRLFVNGVGNSATPISGTPQSSSGTALTIGAGNGTYLNAYVSNLRILRGTALYNTNFTPSAVPLTPIANTSILTCADNRLIDDSPRNLTITRNGDVSVQRFNPFSPLTTTPTSYSAFFDGTGDWLSGIGTTSSFNFMHNTSALFTIEAWVYTGTTGAQQTIACTNGVAASASVGFWVAIETDNTLRLFVTKGSAGNPVINAVSSGTVPLNSWTHVAITYNQSLASNNATFYINGVLSGTGTKTANAPVDSNAGNALNIGSYQGGGAYMVGYISNLRITNSIVYTGAFTPSTTPLTAVANTQLLILQSPTFIDNSTNNFTITNNGDTAPRQFNPFGWTNITSSSAAYTPALYGGSGYFDGTSDWLSIASNAALSWGTGDYTVEAWVYLTSLQSRIMVVSGVGNFAFFTNSSGNVIVGRVGTDELTSTGTVPLNQWVHIAATRASNTTRIFINGILSSTPTSITTNYGQNLAYIGSDASVMTTGYISDFRATKGQALYTSNFQPPVAPLTAIQNTVLLNNMTGAGIYDSSMMSVYETNGTSRSTTSIKRYGNTSVQFSGSNYLISASNPAFALGTGDYTIEAWVYPTSIRNGENVIYAVDVTGGTSFGFSQTQVYIGARGVAYDLQVSYTVQANTWTHLVAARQNGTVRIFANGTLVGSGSVTRSCPQGPAGVGDYPSLTGNGITGHISDLRVTRGIARYTANFTSPTSPFIQY